MKTPGFDIMAFINSPSIISDGDPIPMLPSALDDIAVNMTDNDWDLPGKSNVDANLIPSWATSSPSRDTNSSTWQTKTERDTVMTAASQVTPPIASIENTSSSNNNNNGTTYENQIAAYHSLQLQKCLSGGGPVAGASTGLIPSGQRNQGGSYSCPIVPKIQGVQNRKEKEKSELTIQERRRLYRRSQTIATESHSMPLTKAKSVDCERSSSENQILSTTTSKQRVSEQALQILKCQGFGNKLIKEAKEQANGNIGFDLIAALLKVAQRPNPRVDLGPLDLSCSFTISDAQHPEQPIVHCSDTFCTLTGYARHEIIGRNCRFLQSPNGQVSKGSHRIHTDTEAVKHFKMHCSRLQECQASLLNYRKDGTSFINLVTVVPITWDDRIDPVFLVGFQVDLIEQPGAVGDRMANGLYKVDYRDMVMPVAANLSNSIGSSSHQEKEAKSGTITEQEVASLVSNNNNNTAECSKWAQMLLQNSRDMIHVISIKGTFLYVSPSVEALLGYKAEEMVGKSLSDFCHPSDVVPVYREIKDSTSNATIAAAAAAAQQDNAQVQSRNGVVNRLSRKGENQFSPQVNLIMRMKHKHCGYVWIENFGKLHFEKSKGRKVVISTGRLRPSYNLAWEQVSRTLTHKGPGFWSKVSKEGLILSNTGSVSDVLETDPNLSLQSSNCNLVGLHLRDVVNKDAMHLISSGLQSDNMTAVPHFINNGYGGPYKAVISTLFPSLTPSAGFDTIFVYTQRAESWNLGTLPYNKAPSQVPIQCVFKELATDRTSNWLLELHHLKVTNRRLREDIQQAKERKIRLNQNSKPVKLQQLKADLIKKPTFTSKPLLSMKNVKSVSSIEVSTSSISASSNSRPGSSPGSTDSTSATSNFSDLPSIQQAAGIKRPRS